MNYLLVKEDRIVTLSKTDTGWNYRKEFGTALMDNFNFTEDKLVGFISELESIGYKVIEGPKAQDKEEIIESVTEYGIKLKSWYKNGLLHREDGPAIEYETGEKHWYINGLLHRDDGPAVEGAPLKKYQTGYRFESWYKEGKLHRLDGPAITYASGDKFWYEDDKFIKSDLNISDPLSVYHLKSKTVRYWFNSMMHSYIL